MNAVAVSPGSVALMALKFAPNAIAGLDTWLDSSDTNNVTYASGTQPGGGDGTRVISALGNKGSGGGNFSQGTSANRGTAATYHRSNGATIRALVLDGSDDTYSSSRGAADYKYYHDDTDATIVLVIRTGDKSTAAYSYRTTSGTAASDTGFRAHITGGNLKVQVANGTANIIDTSNAISENTTYRVVLRKKKNGSNLDYDLRINGTSTDSGTTASGPSSSNPDQAAQIGDATSPQQGPLPAVLSYTSYLSDSQVTALENYLTAKWPLEHDATSDANDADRSRVMSLNADNATGTTDAATVPDADGNYDVTFTAATAPVINSGHLNGHDALTFDDTNNEHGDIDSNVTSVLNGDDTAWTLVEVLDVDGYNNGNFKFSFSAGNSSTNDRIGSAVNGSGETYLELHDGTSSDTKKYGSLSGNEPMIRVTSRVGQDVRTVWYSASDGITIASNTQNVGDIQADAVRLGCQLSSGSEGNHWKGDWLVTELFDGATSDGDALAFIDYYRRELGI